MKYGYHNTSYLSNWVEIDGRTKVVHGASIMKFLNELPKDTWEWDICFAGGEQAIEFVDAADATAFRIKFGL